MQPSQVKVGMPVYSESGKFLGSVAKVEVFHFVVRDQQLHTERRYESAAAVETGGAIRIADTPTRRRSWRSFLPIDWWSRN